MEEVVYENDQPYQAPHQSQQHPKHNRDTNIHTLKSAMIDGTSHFNTNSKHTNAPVATEMILQQKEDEPNSRTDNYSNNNTTSSSSSNGCYCDEEEEVTIVSMSPDERNTFFPSRRSSALQQHNNINNHNQSRESVLQRLCEALLRRSLTKVRGEMEHVEE
jgi:hypothetical protein